MLTLLHWSLHIPFYGIAHLWSAEHDSNLYSPLKMKCFEQHVNLLWQSHRIIRVGKDLWRSTLCHAGPPTEDDTGLLQVGFECLQRGETLQPHCAACSRTILNVKKFFLMWNFLWFRLRPLCPALLIVTTVKWLAPSSWTSSFETFIILMTSPLSLL